MAPSVLNPQVIFTQTHSHKEIDTDWSKHKNTLMHSILHIYNVRVTVFTIQGNILPFKC